MPPDVVFGGRVEDGCLGRINIIRGKTNRQHPVKANHLPLVIAQVAQVKRHNLTQGNVIFFGGFLVHHNHAFIPRL